MAIDQVQSRPRATGMRRLFGAAAGGTSIAAGLCALAMAGLPLAMINGQETAGKIMGHFLGMFFSITGVVVAGMGLVAGIAGFFSGKFSGRVLCIAGLVASGFGMQLSIHLLQRIGN